MNPGPSPRWLVTWMAVTGLLLGATIAVLIWAVLDLHTHNAAADQRLCTASRTDRQIDRDIIAAARLRITVPPLTREECP